MSHSLGKDRAKNRSCTHQNKGKQTFSKKGLLVFPEEPESLHAYSQNHYTYIEQYQVTPESHFGQSLPSCVLHRHRQDRQVSNEAIIRSQAEKIVKRLANNFEKVYSTQWH